MATKKHKTQTVYRIFEECEGDAVFALRDAVDRLADYLDVDVDDLTDHEIAALAVADESGLLRLKNAAGEMTAFYLQAITVPVVRECDLHVLQMPTTTGEGA